MRLEEELAEWRRLNDADVLTSALFLYELKKVEAGRTELAERARKMQTVVGEIISTLDAAWNAENERKSE